MLDAGDVLLESALTFGPAWSLLILGMVLAYRVVNRLVDIWERYLMKRADQVGELLSIASNLLASFDRLLEFIESRLGEEN